MKVKGADDFVDNEKNRGRWNNNERRGFLPTPLKEREIQGRKRVEGGWRGRRRGSEGGTNGGVGGE